MYDDDAKKWLAWSYFKNLLEGEPVMVARPKNKGGNVPWKSDAPVFLTAPQDLRIYKTRRRKLKKENSKKEEL